MDFSLRCPRHFIDVTLNEKIDEDLDEEDLKDIQDTPKKTVFDENTDKNSPHPTPKNLLKTLSTPISPMWTIKDAIKGYKGLALAMKEPTLLKLLTIFHEGGMETPPKIPKGANSVHFRLQTMWSGGGKTHQGANLQQSSSSPLSKLCKKERWSKRSSIEKEEGAKLVQC